MQRRHLLRLLPAAAACAAAPVWAQGFPTRPIKLIVAFPAGGPTDITMRVLADGAAKVLGQPVIVENRPGAGGSLPAQALQSAPADGYTLAQIPQSIFRLPYTTKLNWDPVADIAYVINVTGYAFGVVVPAGSPFKNWADFVAYAKANPGKLSYATSGIGTSNHLATELLQSVAGIQLTGVPYKGSSQIVPDLLSGVVLMSMESSLATTLQHVKAGKLKAIAVTSPQRAKALPDVPTVAESGYPGFAVETWFGLVAPAATPPTIVGKLHDAWALGARSAEAQAAFDNISGSLRVTSPQEFGAFIKAENQRWGDLIRKLGIKADS